MSYFKIVLSATILTFAITDYALADCDPLKILVQDHYNLTTDKRNALITNQEKDDIKTNDQSSNASWIGYGVASGGESDKFSQAIKERFHLDYRSSSQRWEAYTHLSDNARQAYSDCLKASDENIFILPDASVNADATSIVLNLSVRNYIPQKNAIEMDGTFSSDQETLPPAVAKQKMYPGSTAVFVLKRAVDKSLTFVAKIGTQARPFVIPPQDNFLVKRELRYSKAVTTYGHSCDECHDTHEICVELDNDDDAVIIPGTAQFVALRNVQDGLLHGMSLSGDYSPKKVCMRGGQNVGKNKANLIFCGYETVEVLAKVPRGQANSSRSTLPAYYGNKDTCYKP